MHSNLKERLSIVPEAELTKLIGMFKARSMPEYHAGMTDHFRIAKEKTGAFADHPKVLGISFGGTNTKLMLASMKNGDLTLHHAVAEENPREKVHVFKFFDRILLKNPIFYDYLKKTAVPIVGISVPTRVLDKIPFHETKVPTIDGLLARNKSQMTDEYDLSKSFARYLKKNNLPDAVLFYQADGIVAHHGAVSLCDMGVNDRSTLIVCGTGMATGDEESYIQAGIVRMLGTEDEELFPANETENYQYHYATAGKGIYSLMRRAVQIRSKEAESTLKKYDVTPFFANNHGTKTVGDIWASYLGKEPVDDAKKLKDMLTPEAFRELEHLSHWIMKRCTESIAVTTVSTIAKMGIAPSRRGHHIFFEGSIANDTCVNPFLKKEIQRLIGLEEIYQSFDLEKPLLPNMDVKYRPVNPVDKNAEDELKNTDLTVIGAVTMAMAENIRRHREK